MDLSAYLPVILFILVGTVIGILPQVLGFVLGPRRPDAQKNSPYECGFEAFEDARMKFDVRYYLVAILFILFDLEIAFLFPWAVALKDIGHSEPVLDQLTSTSTEVVTNPSFRRPSFPFAAIAVAPVAGITPSPARPFSIRR